MAKKKEEEAADKEDDFSIILGAGRKPAKKEEAPVEEIVQPEEKKPERPRTPEELLRKKEELELFLLSLEDAHKESKFPEYAYEKSKKSAEMQLRAIKNRLGDVQPAAAARASGSGAAQTAAKADKKGGSAAQAEAVGVLSYRIQKIEDAFGRVPELKEQLERLKDEIGEYEKVMAEMKGHEDKIEKDLSEIRKSVSSISKGTVPADGAETRGSGIKRSVSSAVRKLGDKVDSVSKRLESMFSSLKNRVDQMSVIEEVETEKYASELKKNLDQIRAEMSGFVRKDDLGRMTLKPVVTEAASAETASATREEKKQPGEPVKGTIPLEDLAEHVGEDVKVECVPSLIKSIEEKKMRLYWYRLQDETGEGILTSYGKVEEKKAVIAGTVKKTRTGAVYLFSKKQE